MFQTVGDNMSTETASEFMISTLQGFQLQAEESMAVIDKYNEVANNFAIDTAGIGEALTRSAASFNAANTSLSESIALVTATNEVVQNPEAVGTLWKTLSARIRGSKTELQELGEEEDKFTETTSKLRDLVKSLTGFDIMKDKDTYKSIYEIILGIGKEWDKLTDIEQASLGEALAGKRNANALFAVLGNLDTLQDAYATAEDSAGSAEREMENYTRSLQYSLDRAKASLEELSYDLLDSDMLKGGLEFINSLIKAIDTLVEHLDPLSASLAALGIGGGVGFVKNFKSLVRMGEFSEALDSAKGLSYSAANLDKVSDALKTLDASQRQVLLSTTKFSQAQREMALVNAGLSEEVAQFDARMSVVNKDIGVGTPLVTKLKLAYEGLARSLGMTTASFSAFLGVTGVLALGIKTAYDAYKVTEVAGESSQQYADEYKQVKDEIEKYKEEILSLQETLSDSNTSYDESKAARERLYEIQSSLIQNYGTEREAILSVTDAINGQIEALDNLSKDQWIKKKNEFNNQDLMKGPDAIVLRANDAADAIGLMLNQVEGRNGNLSGKSVNIKWETEADKKFLEQISSLYGGHVLETRQAGLFNKKKKEFITGTGANTIYDLYDNLIQIQKEAEKAGDTLSTTFVDSLNEAASGISEIADRWKDFYDQYVLNEYIFGQAYEENYSKYLKQFDEYKKAYAIGDEKAINESVTNLHTLYTELQTALDSDSTISDAVKASILRAFDNIAPELQSKLKEQSFEIDLSDKIKFSQDDRVLGQVLANVADKFKYAEDIQYYVEESGTKQQEQAYQDLIQLQHDYGISLEYIIGLLKERNGLESRADVEYIAQMKKEYEELAIMAGKSKDEVSKYAAGWTDEDWLNAGDRADDFIKKLGFIKQATADIIPTFEEAKSSAQAFISGNDQMGAEIEAVKAVLADVKNVSAESYEALLSYSNKYASALTIQNGRLTVNRSKIIAVANSRNKERQQTLKQATAYKKLELIKRYKELKLYDTELKTTTQDTYDQIAALEQEITELDLLSNTLEQCADAFERFKEAQDTPDSPYYDTVQEAYKSIGEGLESGFVGTDDFKYAQQLLYSADAYKEFTAAAEEGYGAQRKFAEQWQKEHAQFFTEDDYQNAKNFYNWLTETGLLADGQLAASSTIGEVGGMSHDFVNAMIEKINLLDFDGEVIKQSPVDFIDDATQALTNASNAKQALNDAIKEGADPNLLTDLEQEYDRAQAGYEAFMERIPDTFKKTQEKLDEGMSLSEALYGGKDGLTTVQQHNLSAFLETLGLRIDETKDKIAQLNKETNGSILDPESEKGKELAKLQQDQQTLQTIQNSLAHAQYNEQASSISDRITQAKNAQDRLRGLKETREHADNLVGIDTDALDAQIQAAQAAVNSLVDEDYIIQLQLDSQVIDQEINAVKNELEGLKETKVSMGGSTAAQEAVQSAINAKKSQISDLEGQKEEINRIVNFKVEGIGEVEDAKGTIDSVEDKDVTVSAAVKGLDDVARLKQQIEAIPTTKTVSVNVAVSGAKSLSSSVIAGVNGTAHAEGSGDNWGLKSNENGALVGELGTEGLVRDGRFYLIGKKGAERRNLKKGDIIFNHKQTEELLENGYVTDRGKLIGGSFVDGTLIGTAHSMDQNNQTTGEWVYSRGASSVSKSVQKAAKETADAIEDDIDETEEAAETASDNFIDWIERKVKYITTYAERYFNQTQKLLDRITNTVSSKAYKVFNSTVNSVYKSAMKRQKDLMNVQKDAAEAYKNLTNAVGLDPIYAERVKYGLMEIENVTDEALSDQISKYQDFYDKSQSALDAFIEAADKFYHMPIDKAATKIENLSNKIDYLSKKAENATNYKDRNALLDEQDKDQKEIYKKQQNAAKQTEKARAQTAKKVKKTALKEAKDDLKQQKKEVKSKKVLATASKKAQKEIKEATKNEEKINLKKLKKGTKAYREAQEYNKALESKKSTQDAIKTKNILNIADFEEGSAAYNAVIEYNAAVNASTEAWNNVKTAEEEWLHWHEIEYPKAKFDNIVKDFSHAVDLLNQDFTDYENEINTLVKTNRKVSTQYYVEQKKLNVEKLKQYDEERTKLEEQIKSIKKYSDEWYDARAQIKEVDNAISQLEQSTIDLNKAITQLFTNAKDGMIDDYQWLSDEIELYKTLMSHMDKTDEKTGGFTNEGKIDLTLLSTQADLARKQLQTEQDLLEKVQKMRKENLLEYDGLVFNSKEERLQYEEELQKSQMSRVRAVYEAENAQWEAMKNQLQTELKYYQDLTNKRKESLNAEKDLYEYQKKIAEKTKNIALLEKQLAAYRGDTSQEGQAKRQKLQKDLTNAQEDLRDTEYDRYISDQQQMLDDMMTEYEERIEVLSKNRDDLLKKANDIAEANEANTANIVTKLNDKNDYIPVTMGNLTGNNSMTTVLSQYLGDSGTVVQAIKSANAVSDKDVNAVKTVNGNTGQQDATKGNGSATKDNSAQIAQLNSLKAAVDKKSAEVDNLMNKETIAREKYNNANVKYEEAKQKYKTKKTKSNKAKMDKAEQNEMIAANNYNEAHALYSIAKKELDDLLKQYNALSKSLNGASKGGLVEAIKKNGDDGIATLKVGEAILTPTDSKNLASLSGKIDALDFSADILRSMKENMKTGSGAVAQTINYGGVTFDIDIAEANDPDAIVDAIQKDTKVQKAIQSVSVDRLNNGGRLSVQRIK